PWFIFAASRKITKTRECVIHDRTRFQEFVIGPRIAHCGEPESLKQANEKRRRSIRMYTHIGANAERVNPIVTRLLKTDLLHKAFSMRNSRSQPSHSLIASGVHRSTLQSV